MGLSPLGDASVTAELEQSFSKRINMSKSCSWRCWKRVYVDHKGAKAVVAIQPKPAFRAVFQVATTREGSGVVLIKEPPDQAQEAPSPC